MLDWVPTDECSRGVFNSYPPPLSSGEGLGVGVLGVKHASAGRGSPNPAHPRPQVSLNRHKTVVRGIVIRHSKFVIYDSGV